MYLCLCSNGDVNRNHESRCRQAVREVSAVKGERSCLEMEEDMYHWLLPSRSITAASSLFVRPSSLLFSTSLALLIEHLLPH